MSFSLTAEQVLNLAPDDSSAKSGRDLASTRKWTELGTNGALAWGLCQGSGSTPYQACVDLGEVGFKCSCPSRKFPCKHGLGLLLLLVKEPSAFSGTQAPSWSLAWLEGRQERSAKKAQKSEEPPKPVDKEAQAKRAAKRENKVGDGIEDLDRWLQDVIRHGLAELQSKPYHYWEAQAARLVDAQAPGLARLVRECGGIVASGGEWQERLLDRLGRLHLLLESYKRAAELPPELAAETRNLIGFTVSQEEVLAQQGIRDKWFVAGQSVEEDERLKTQRTWLMGESSGKPALVLAFAYGNSYLDTSLVPGTKVEAEVVFFPGAASLRALVKSKQGQPQACHSIPTENSTIDSVYKTWSESLAKNPWTEISAVTLKDVRPVPIQGGRSWEIQDEGGDCLKMGTSRDMAWSILAFSQGRPLNMFGEWNGRRFYPLSVSQGDKFMRCNVFSADR